jgi:hypothetical protein
LIYEALQDIFSEFWSIVVYDTFDAEAGCGTFFHYDNKWWVYGVSTRNWWSYDFAAIRAFMGREFGYLKFSGDIKNLQAAAESRVNKKFEGSWKVQVVKPRPRSWRSATVFGEWWEHDGYMF